MTDRLRLQPRSHRRARQERLQGDRAAEDQRADRQAGRRREGDVPARSGNEHEAERLPALQLAARYEFSEDLTSLFNLADYYNKIDAATIRDAARLYLKPDNVVKVTLFPEKVGAPEPLPAAAAR